MADPISTVLGSSPRIVELREQLGRLASFDTVGNPRVPTVLITGETGTGKGLIARVLHDSGPRAKNPFIDVNCAAIPDTMLEAELFGFEAGAFTDARRAKPGLFEAASSGTLFLDEIDSLTLPLQTKLLKAIEEKSVRRLGAVAARKVDVKLIAATQRGLETLVEAGRFRADLYHRLAVLLVDIPPLRERGDDVVLLAEHFLREFARAHALAPRPLGEEARRWLRARGWPGNVRELCHLAERITLLAPEGDLRVETLERLAVPTAPHGLAPAGGATPGESPNAGGARSTAEQEAEPGEAGEAERIRSALLRTGGNVVAAARMLGLGRNALRYRMRRLGIEKPSLEDLARPGARTPEPDGSAADAAPEPPSGPATTWPHAAGNGWEQKRVATVAIEVFFPEASDAEPAYEPWTAAARWKRSIEEKLLGFGGVLLEQTVSRISAAFGLPRALEQTPQRAVQAALAVQRLALAEKLPRPQVRIAVHLGEVRLVPGDTLRTLAIGDTLALPERLLGHAAPGEVLVSARVARMVATSCELAPRSLRLGPRPEDEITAYLVVSGRSSQGVTASAAATAPGFVGRAREIEMLEEAYASADAGHGQVVFLTGEAGIGKSRLLLELRARLAGREHLWIEGRCAAYAATTPFFPVLDGIRRFFGLEDRDDDASASAKVAAGIAAFGDDLAWTLPFVRQILSLPASGDAAIAALDSASRRSETFRALRALLLRAAEEKTIVLVVEDLHWIDPTSEEFIAFVADAIPALRALLVCSHRPGYSQPFGDRSYQVRLTVRPLTADEMAAMTRGLLDAAEMPAELLALVARKAEGNPFFVEEVTRSLLEEGSLANDGARVVLTRDLAEISIPDTIQDVLVARLDRLADESRRALQVASVIGREFALRLLERIAESGGGLRTHLDELRAVELIYEKALHPELAYMFKHALTHDVAYQSVVAERRRSLHRTIGLAIEELYADRLEEHLETLAHHFERGEDWPRALAYHDWAAEKAADRHATHAVVEHCRQALAIADRLGERAAPDVRCRLEARLGLACFYLSDFAASGAAFERAAKAASDPAMPALYSALAAQSHFWAHDYERARSLVDGVLAASPDPGPAARAMALNMRGFTAAVFEGDLPAARSHYADATRLCGDRFPDVEASIGFNRTLYAEWTGDYRTAIALAERVMAAGKALKLAHLVVWPYWFLGKAHCCLGDYGAAIALLREGYQFCDRIGDRAWKSRLLNTLGWCYGEIGAHEGARDVNRRAAEIAHQLGDPEIVSNSEINLALDHLALGRIGEAEELLDPIVQALSRPGDPWMRWRYSLHTLDARARIALVQRQPEAALAFAEEERAAARRHLAPKLEARASLTAARALILLERRDDAEERLGAALEIAERIAYPRAAWQANGLLAEVYRRRGKDSPASERAAASERLLEAAARSLADDVLRGQLLASATAGLAAP